MPFICAEQHQSPAIGTTHRHKCQLLLLARLVTLCQTLSSMKNQHLCIRISLTHPLSIDSGNMAKLQTPPSFATMNSPFLWMQPRLSMPSMIQYRLAPPCLCLTWSHYKPFIAHISARYCAYFKPDQTFIWISKYFQHRFLNPTTAVTLPHPEPRPYRAPIDTVSHRSSARCKKRLQDFSSELHSHFVEDARLTRIAVVQASESTQLSCSSCKEICRLLGWNGNETWISVCDQNKYHHHQVPNTWSFMMLDRWSIMADTKRQHPTTTT